MSKAGDRILRSARQARTYARGETTEGFVVHVNCIRCGDTGWWVDPNCTDEFYGTDRFAELKPCGCDVGKKFLGSWLCNTGRLKRDVTEKSS